MSRTQECHADLVVEGMAFEVFVIIFMGGLAVSTLGMLALAVVLLQRNRARESGSAHASRDPRGSG